jgi:uncharacterized protein (DUF2236 family)
MLSALRQIRELLQPPPGMAFDFSQPPGEPALMPADGVSWRVFANPVALFIGGVAAVLIARVVRMHEQVQGATPGGIAYHANDPRLLDWVHATATFGFTQAYARYAGALSAEEKNRAFAESGASAGLYGALGAPRSWAAWETLLAATAPGLEGSQILDDFLRIMAKAALLPAPMRPLQALLVRAAVDIAPEPVRSLPQLRGRGLRPGEAALVRVLARTAMLLPLGDTPPLQAARRLKVPHP